MKGRITLLFMLATLLNLNAQTTRVWSGLAGDNLFSTGGNWVGGTAPDVSGIDDVLFSSGAVNCNFDINVLVTGFTITAGYTGTVDALATQPVVTGNFVQSGATFISSSDQTQGLVVGGNLSLTGGSFVHNSGRVIIVPQPASSVTGGTFNILDIQKPQFGSTTRTISFSGVSTGTLQMTGGDVFNIQGDVNVSNRLNLNGSTATGTPANNTGTLTFSGSNPITIVGGTSAGRGKIPNVVLNTTNTISISNFVSVQGNWTHTSGTLTSGTSTVGVYGACNVSGAMINGSNLTFDNLFVTSTGSLTLPTSTANIVVNKTFSMSGTMSNGTSAVIGFNGTSSAISGTNITLGTIRVANGASLTLNAGVSVADSLSLAGSGSISTGNNLTLTASLNKKGRIGRISTGSISGNITMQTFLPGGNANWSLLGTPGFSSQTINSWQNNPLPMTCNNCLYTPAQANNFYSIQGWDGNDFVADATIDASTSLPVGTGWWVYVGSNTATASDFVLSNTGAPVTGNIGPLTANTGSTDFALLANPYPSPISVDAFLATNGGNFNSPIIYVYDGENNAWNLYGQGMGQVIASGQGFYVDGQSPQVSYSESMKSDQNGSSVSVQRTSNRDASFDLKITGAWGEDKSTIMFAEDATHGRDRSYDVRHFPYPAPYWMLPSIATQINGKDFMVNAMPPLSQSVTVPLTVIAPMNTTYTFEVTNQKNFTSCLILKDNLDGSYHDLNASAYDAAITTTDSPSRFELLICQDPYAITGVDQLDPMHHVLISKDKNGLYVRTQFAETADAVISAYNVIGQKIMADIRVNGKETETRLPIEATQQVVIIKVSSPDGTTARKVIH